MTGVGALLRAVAVACVAGACVPAAAALPDDGAVRALLAERIAQKRAVGLAAVLLDARGTRIVTAGRVREGGPPIAADTEFEIGSLTKTFTSLLLADAVVRGAAALDDPVTTLLPAPGLTRDGSTVTLRQLATHTSGLPRLPRNLAPANPADPYADYDGAKLAAALAADTLERAPGEGYAYSNFGAGVLGHALGAADGGYEAALRRRILVPLHMTDTAVVLSGAQRLRFATGHDRNLAPVPPWHLTALAGAGGLRSTPVDMAKYLGAATNVASSPLAAAFALAEKPLVDGPSPSLRIALAWHVLARQGRTFVWHNGQTGGFASMMAFDPGAGEGVVVLSNASVSVDDLALHLLDASIPLALPPKERVAVKVSQAAIERIVGRYQLAADFVITIRRDGDRAFARATGQPEAEIFAEGEYEYFYKVVDAQLSFLHDGGKVDALVLHQAGRDLTARRID